MDFSLRSCWKSRREFTWPPIYRRVSERASGAYCRRWWEALGTGSIVLVWRDTTAVGNLRIETLGEPPKEIIDADGILLVKRS